MNNEIQKLLDLARASSMLNTIKGIQDNFCSRFDRCNGCPITPKFCVGYEINEATRKVDFLYAVAKENIEKGAKK